MILVNVNPRKTSITKNLKRIMIKLLLNVLLLIKIVQLIIVDLINLFNNYKLNVSLLHLCSCI